MRVRPVQLETGGQRRNPHLPDGRVGGDDKPGAILERDMQGSRLVLHFEVGGFFGHNQTLLERLQGGVRALAKIILIEHEGIIEAGSSQLSAKPSIFAAMMKSLSVRPLILWVHKVISALP